MSERGVFAVDRGIWDHPSFAQEPFTEREAWQWLIGEASYKARIRRVASSVIALKRGQLAASVRFMAKRFDWTPAKVQRFLARLKTDTMVIVETIQGISVVTICNYDKYQKVSLPKDTATDTQIDTAPIQPRYKREDTESKEVVVVVEERARVPLISPEVFILADKLCALAGHDPKNPPPGWCGAAMRVQTWRNEGWSAEFIMLGAQVGMAKARGSPIHSVQFFENFIASEIARQSKPLPTVEVQQSSQLKVFTNGQPQAGNIIHAADTLVDKLRLFEAGPGDIDEIRSGEGATVVRLLPQGGR